MLRLTCARAVLLTGALVLHAPVMPAATLAAGPASLALYVEATSAPNPVPGDVGTDLPSSPAGSLVDLTAAAVAQDTAGLLSAAVTSNAAVDFVGTTRAIVDFATTWTLATAGEGGGIAYDNLFSLTYTPLADGFLLVAYGIDFVIPRLTRRGSSPFSVGTAGATQPAIAMSFLETSGTLAGSRSFPVASGVPVTLLISEIFAIDTANFTGTEVWTARFDVSFAPATIVPLPAAGWLLFGGLASLAACRRRSTA